VAKRADSTPETGEGHKVVTGTNTHAGHSRTSYRDRGADRSAFLHRVFARRGLSRAASARRRPLACALRFALAGLALAALGACGSTGDKVETGKPVVVKKAPPPSTVGEPTDTDPRKGKPGAPVRVALLLPLSGQYQTIGEAMRKAAEMAVFETGSTNFTLIPIDTLGTPEGAQAALEKAIEAKAQLVLGPLFSTSVQAIRARALEAQLNIIAFSNNDSVAGNNVFLISFLPKPPVDRIISYAASQNLQRIAVLAPRNDYGNKVVAWARNAATKANVTVTRVGFYDAASTDISKEVQGFAGVLAVGRKGKVARSAPLDFDAVLIPEGGQKLRLVASLLAYYEVDPDKIRFLGTGQWDSATIRSEPSLKNGWFAAPPPDGRERFMAKYEAANKARPPRLASLAYDAVALAATLARREAGADFTIEAITNPSGFAGIDGIFRFDTNGLSERGLAVMEVTPEEFRIISGAPATFATPTN